MAVVVALLAAAAIRESAGVPGGRAGWAEAVLGIRALLAAREGTADPTAAAGANEAGAEEATAGSCKGGNRWMRCGGQSARKAGKGECITTVRTASEAL